jgi:hypothetical protein
MTEKIGRTKSFERARSKTTKTSRITMTTLTIYDGTESVGSNKIHVEAKSRRHGHTGTPLPLIDRVSLM